MPAAPPVIPGRRPVQGNPWAGVSLKDQLFASGTGNPNISPTQQRLNMQQIQQGTYRFQQPGGGQPGFGPTSGVQMPQAGQPMGPAGNRMGGQLTFGNQPAPAASYSVPSAAGPSNSLLSGSGGGGVFGGGVFGGTRGITLGPVLSQQQVQQKQNQLRATPAHLPITDASAGGALSQLLSDLVGQQGERSAIDFGLQAAADNARQSFAAKQAGSRAQLGRGSLAASDAISRLGDQGKVMSILLSLIGDLIPSGSGLMNIPQATFSGLGNS